MEVCATPQSAKWFTAREDFPGLTGSRVPAACHRGYITRQRLWDYKTGAKVETFSEYQQKIMEEGVEKEPYARWDLQEYLGRSSIPCGAFRRDQFMTTPDALFVNDPYGISYVWDEEEGCSLKRIQPGAVTVVELKCPSHRSIVLDKVPPHETLTQYIIQAEVHAYCTQANDSYLYIWTPDERGSILYHRTFDRHLFETIIVPFTDEFLSYVERKVRPPPESAKDPLVMRLKAWEQDQARAYRESLSEK